MLVVLCYCGVAVPALTFATRSRSGEALQSSTGPSGTIELGFREG